MKTFHCDKCDNVLFFENVLCGRCGETVAFDPARTAVVTLTDKPLKLCRNYAQENVCNWAVGANDPLDYCLSCRLTRLIPDLTQPGFRDAWFRMEAAKRRMIYTLLGLNLPVLSKDVDPAQGLAFEFKSDSHAAPGEPVLTGHDEGLITLNVAEANDAEREKRRMDMHEPYRTLLGHFRHEIGHYYWDRLIRDTPRLAEYRALFGDESVDYAESLQRHYDQGPPADWNLSYVSTYATSHPWEDWAETWAHYLHMIDSLDTAAACGVTLLPSHSDEPVISRIHPDPARERFDRLMKNWFALTYALNNLNRSMGLQDAYPFVLPDPALAKLRFVHEVISGELAAAAAA
ncbi:MAG: putative zinc-binding metallopeptidase [Pseudomonadota bacterium]